MNFVTKVVTTYFFAPILFSIQAFKTVFLPLIEREGGYIWGLLSPKQDKVIDYIIESPCFYSGDKSGDTFQGGRWCE